MRPLFDVLILEDETTMLSRNVERRSFSDAAPHPRRTVTPTAPLRTPNKRDSAQYKFVYLAVQHYIWTVSHRMQAEQSLQMGREYTNICYCYLSSVCYLCCSVCYLCCSVVICVVRLLLFVLFGCYLCCSVVVICVVRLLLFVLFGYLCSVVICVVLCIVCV
jgi:hypothetical protein